MDEIRKRGSFLQKIALTNVYKMRIIYIRGGVLLKQRDLIKKLEKAGFLFERHGSNHDIYVRGSEKEEVPRHREIDERLAKAIMKRRGLE